MTKIGIIRCQERALSGKTRCAGWNCFPAIKDKTMYMDEYDTIELVGFDTCGGCPGLNRFEKIVERGQELKKKGAEVIHLSTCIVLFCPNKDKFVEVLKKKVRLPIKEKTHGRPGGGEFKAGEIVDGVVIGQKPAPASTNKSRASRSNNK
jgi:predicted metal-binding protein